MCGASIPSIALLPGWMPLPYPNACVHASGTIQDHRRELSIGEYSLSQTSLEQIFNRFAAQQEEELGRPAGMV